MFENFNTGLQPSSARRRGNTLSFKQRKKDGCLWDVLWLFFGFNRFFSKPSGILKRLQVQQKITTTQWVRSQTASRRRERETVTRRTRGCWRWWRFWPEDGRRFFFSAPPHPHFPSSSSSSSFHGKPWIRICGWWETEAGRRGFLPGLAGGQACVRWLGWGTAGGRERGSVRVCVWWGVKRGGLSAEELQHCHHSGFLFFYSSSLPRS